MTNRSIEWWMVYASVISIRLHPKNDGQDQHEDIDKAITYAMEAADKAGLLREWTDSRLKEELI